MKMFREFIKLESSAAVFLFLLAVLALILDNTPWHIYYKHILNIPIAIQFGDLALKKPLLLWVNDGFMGVFFMLVGLEIKREMIKGELNSFAKAILPGIAAAGGMLVPALIYYYFNHHSAVALRGWAIPTATDIAFSLGIVALLGSRIPSSLKIFLTALAIFDDIGAIVVIAVFYTKHISMILLFVSLLLALFLLVLNRLRVTHFAPYILIGIVLWVCVLKSGVHATLAGILVALAIPMDDKNDPNYKPSEHLEHILHPWVAYGILPMFAFMNAGVDFRLLKVDDFYSSVPIGIALGLFIGKQIGIWGASILAVKCKIADMPHNASGAGIYGVALVAGVGFTMSLFIGSLAFDDYAGSYPAFVRVGVLAGSFLSGVCGYLLLRFSHR